MALLGVAVGLGSVGCSDTSDSLADGDAHADFGRYEPALRAYREALVAAPDDTRAMTRTARALIETGAPEEARELLERAITLDTESYGPESASVARDLHLLGLLEAARGDLDAARRNLRRALELDTAVFSENHDVVARDLEALAQIERRAGRLDDAVALYERAHASIRTALGASHTAVGWLRARQASMLREAGRSPDATAAFADAIEVLSKGVSPGHPGLLDVRRELIALHRAEGSAADAIAVALDADEDVLILHGLGSLEADESASALRDLLAESQKGALSTHLEAEWRAVRDRGEAGAASEDALVAARRYALSLARDGREEEAGKLLEEVLEDERARYGRRDRRVALTSLFLGDLFQRAQPERAARYYVTASAILAAVWGDAHPAVQRLRSRRGAVDETPGG